MAVTVDTSHEDMIHDTQFDYYGKKLATCSSDRTVKIFNVFDSKYILSATLTGHEGPVWQIAWAHPKFGVLLASCSYDGCVHINRESSPNSWSKVYEHKFQDCSVNSIGWAPHEHGLILACAASDGKITILEHSSNSWSVRSFQNDFLGCNSVSWAPFNALGSAGEDSASVKRLVTGACDNVVRIWRSVGSDGEWSEESRQGSVSHTDWVRDVAWSPNSALSSNLIASCSEDRSVLIWRQVPSSQSSMQWQASLLKQFEAAVWRLSWSVTGGVLAVSCADHKVSLWKQAADETWVEISSVDASTSN